ncbi:MAG: flavodoxin family protein [Clostridia bacterium]|nr:flavodoxin family protein [Clostridia bacterium]
MNQKVVMVDGSARKKNTFRVLQDIGQILKKRGFDAEILDLFAYDLKDCAGCETCVGHDGCSLADDMPVLMQKLAASDAVVFSSPVYMGGVTSKFKTFADRTNAWVHKPEMAGKPVLFVATTAATGRKEIKRFFKTYAAGLGARRGDFVSRAGKKMNLPVREQEMSHFLALLEEDKAQYRPALSEIIMFTVQKVMALKSKENDRAYWEQKEWLDKPYYYPCRMHLGKRAFSKLMFGVLSKAMR